MSEQQVTIDEIVKALEYLYAKRDLIERIKQHGMAPPDGYVLVPVKSTEEMEEYANENCDWDDTEYLLKCAERYGNVEPQSHLHCLAVVLANQLKDEMLARQTMNNELIERIDKARQLPQQFAHTYDTLRDCKAEIERLTKALEAKPREYNEALEIANYLWRNHYAEISPEWVALPDLSGVLSQINNMVAGIPIVEIEAKPVSEPTGRGVDYPVITATGVGCTLVVKF